MIVSDGCLCDIKSIWLALCLIMSMSGRNYRGDSASPNGRIPDGSVVYRFWRNPFAVVPSLTADNGPRGPL